MNTTAVNLNRLVDAVEHEVNDHHVFINQMSGAIIETTDETFDTIQANPIFDMMKDDSHNIVFKMLPTADELRYPEMRMAFANLVHETSLKNKLVHALNMGYSHRTFNRILAMNHLEQAWQLYRHEAVESQVKEWCRREHISYN